MAGLITIVAIGCGGGSGGIGAVGCSASVPAPGATAAKPKLRFAIIPKALDIPVFNYAKIGAERAAAKIGNIEILWNAPATADQLKQKEILESYITQRVDGIAISSLNGDFLTETINKAIDAGIPVTTWDSDAPGVETDRVLRRRRPGVGPHHGRAGDQDAGRQGQGGAHHEPWRRQPHEPV